MLTAPKSALLLILTGFSIYVLLTFLGITHEHYRHVASPPLSESTHPLKTVTEVNDTFDLREAFHNIYYDPYDLYI